jgi:hypothetical protein
MVLIQHPLWRDDECVAYEYAWPLPNVRISHVACYCKFFLMHYTNSLSVQDLQSRSYLFLFCVSTAVSHLNCLSRSRSYFTTDSQLVSMSWSRAPLWDLRPDIISCRNVAVWNLRSCIYGTPSLTRGRVCNLQCNHSMVRVAQNPKPYFTVSSETPPNLEGQVPYLYSTETGWPSYTPELWVPFRSPLTTRRAKVEVS